MKQYKPYQYHSPGPTKRARAKPKSRTRMPKWLRKTRLGQKYLQMSRRRKIFLVVWTGLSALVVIALFTTIYFAGTLGNKQRILNRNNTGVTLLDRHGQVFYQFDNARTTDYVTLDKIAPVTQKAVISAEDKDFYNEPGFSPRGITYALWQNIKPGGEKGGGSTITQQLVKNALLSNRRSLLRKYQELVLSVEIERRYSKDEILEMYLNSVYFGQGAFGIQDAAETYFNVPASKLDLAQSSMLIGLLPAPSAYSPISGSPTKARERQIYVLGRMATDDVITKTQENAAKVEDLTYAPAKPSSSKAQAPDFALMVKQQLIDKYGEQQLARSGFKVKTTLDLDWQAKAQNIVVNQVNNLAGDHVSNGSVVVMDPKTSEILALVGSIDYDNPTFGKVNMATATRQPGSSFKPITYSAGIEAHDFSAATIFEDKPINIGGYAPKDYDLRYRGPVTMRRALANSLNIPAVEAIQEVGVQDTIDNAKKLGLTTINQPASSYGLSLALGSAQARLTEMTNAYATFANQGKINDITTIGSIVNKNGSTVFTYKPKDSQVISPQTSYIMSSVLSDNIARAETFGSSLTVAYNRPAAVKTGTTENYRDAWTIGYTPSLAIGAWVGNNDNSPMDSVAGAMGAAPIWQGLMQQFTAQTPAEQFTIPNDLVARTICRNSGALDDVGSGPGTMTEYFLPNTLPDRHCNSAPIVKPAPPAKTPDKQNQKTTEPTKPPTTGSGDTGNGNGSTSGGSTGTGNGNGSGSGSDSGSGNPIPPTPKP